MKTPTRKNSGTGRWRIAARCHGYQQADVNRFHGGDRCMRFHYQRWRSNPPGTTHGRTGNNASDLGPENKVLLGENPFSNRPPFTDHGNPGPIWYSFDIAPKRIQGGAWTHQVTQRELPSSKDIAGVNMRLTAGSFRELHWHTPPTSEPSC